jgi:hypothetical protein
MEKAKGNFDDMKTSEHGDNFGPDKSRMTNHTLVRDRE